MKCAAVLFVTPDVPDVKNLSGLSALDYSPIGVPVALSNTKKAYVVTGRSSIKTSADAEVFSEKDHHLTMEVDRTWERDFLPLKLIPIKQLANFKPDVLCSFMLRLESQRTFYFTGFLEKFQRVNRGRGGSKRGFVTITPWSEVFENQPV